MNSHGVEISIAGCVREMVQVPNPMPIFVYFLFFFFFIICFVLMNYWEQRLHVALAMVKRNPHPLCFIHPGARGKTINPSLSGARPTAHQPLKIGNQSPTEGAQ